MTTYPAILQILRHAFSVGNIRCDTPDNLVAKTDKIGELKKRALRQTLRIHPESVDGLPQLIRTRTYPCRRRHTIRSGRMEPFSIAARKRNTTRPYSSDHSCWNEKIARCTSGCNQASSYHIQSICTHPGSSSSNHLLEDRQCSLRNPIHSRPTTAQIYVVICGRCFAFWWSWPIWRNQYKAESFYSKKQFLTSPLKPSYW